MVLWAGDNPQEAPVDRGRPAAQHALYHTPRSALHVPGQRRDDRGGLPPRSLRRRLAGDPGNRGPPSASSSWPAPIADRWPFGRPWSRPAVPALMDAATGASFTRDLFAAPLSPAWPRRQGRNRPLSVLRPQGRGKRPRWSARAPAASSTGAIFRRSARWSGRLVRVEDTAARLAPEVFALAPARHQRHERPIGRRAHRRGDRLHRLRGPARARTPFVVDFDLGVAAVTSAETAGRRARRGRLPRASVLKAS